MDPERGIRYAFREQRPLFGVSDPRHAEVGRGEDDGGHVLQMGISQKSDVFEVVGLLDVPDRLFDSPARDVSGDDLPEIGSGRRLCQCGEKHHRLLSEAPHDDHVKEFSFQVRKPYGNYSVVKRDAHLFAV